MTKKKKVRKFVPIPLDQYKCGFCTHWQGKSCGIQGDYDASYGKPRTADTIACFLIHTSFKPVSLSGEGKLNSQPSLEVEHAQSKLSKTQTSYQSPQLGTFQPRGYIE